MIFRGTSKLHSKLRSKLHSKIYYKLLFYLACLALFSGMSWVAIESGMKATGGVEFCSGCHSMQPIAFAYRQDVHGGKNKTGFQAKCVDCHLPQDSTLQYLTRKVGLATHDVFVEFISGANDIDWKAKLDEREHFTYDSGCEKCHGFLQKAPLGNNKAVVAHKPYFADQTEDTCVSCHPHVGHKELEALLTNDHDSDEDEE